jgi:hypothetical protein
MRRPAPRGQTIGLAFLDGHALEARLMTHFTEATDGALRGQAVVEVDVRDQEDNFWIVLSIENAWDGGDF